MRKKYIAAKTIGALMPSITRPVMEKFGFQKAALLTDWDTIIGHPLSQFTAPEQIKWPQRPDHSIEDEARMGSQNKAGATLIIRVEGPASLEVQHQSAQIMERINSYFGYQAISEIRILQAPLNRPVAKAKRIIPDLDKPLKNEVDLPDMDDKLNTAFKRMWRGIQSRKING